MNRSQAADEFIRALTSPENIGGHTLLGICFSLKRGSGRSGRSAARSILSYALNTVGAVYPDVSLLDLRDHPLPFFDGRAPDECPDSALTLVRSCVHRAGALLLSIPAYWSGVSGVFKNFVDTLCGPIYDMEGGAITVFADKPVGLLIVGADHASAYAGADQAHQIMLSTGARLVGHPVIVSDPRHNRLEPVALSQELIVLGGELARSCTTSA